MVKKMLSLTVVGFLVAGAQLHASQIEIKNNTADALKGAFVYTAVFGSGITVAGDFFDIPAKEAVTKEMLPSRLGKQRALFVTSNQTIENAESFKKVFKDGDAIERDMKSLLIPIGRTGTGKGLKKAQVTVGGGGDNKLYLEKGALAVELYRDVKPDFKRLISVFSAGNEGNVADAKDNAEDNAEGDDGFLILDAQPEE